MSRRKLPVAGCSRTPRSTAPSGLSKVPSHFPAAILALGAIPFAPVARAEDSADTKAKTSIAAVELPTVKVVGTTLGNSYKVDTATIGGKQETAVRDIPQVLTVVDETLMEAQGAATLVDALRNVPGITIGAGEGGQIGNNINLRGFSARTDIYLDGFRDRGQYQRDVFSLRAIEVLEGPASLLFGRGSTGGVINQVSQQASRKSAGELALTTGTDDYYRITGGYTDALGAEGAFRFDAMAQNVAPTRDIVTNRDYGLAPSLRFGLGTATEISLSLLSQHNDDIPDYGFPLIRFKDQAYAAPINAPRRRYYGYRNDRFTQDVNVLGIGIDHQFSTTLKLRNHAQYSSYRTQAAATPLGSLLSYNAATTVYSTLTSTTVDAATPLDALLIAVQQRDRIIRDTSLFDQADLLIERQTGSLLHHLAIGGEIGRDEYQNDYFGWYNFNYNNGAGLGANLVDVFSLGARDYADKPSGANVYRVPANDTDTRADTVALYANDQIDIGAHWKLIGGLRWDRYSASQDYLAYCYAASSSCPDVAAGTLSDPTSGLITSNSDPTQTSAVQIHNGAVLTSSSPSITRYSSAHTDYHLSTRGGLIYQPDPRQSYYAAYGTSFNPLAEAVSGLPTSASSEDQYASGGGYAAEKTRSYEIGSKWEVFDRAFSFGTALFQVEKTNARNLDPVTQTYTLAGDVRVNGAELRFSGALLPRWQVFGGYTYLDGKIVSSPVVGNTGSVPQNTPRNAALLWTTYTLSHQWEIGGGANYSSSVWTNNTDTARVPGYTRYDATAAYRLHTWTARLNLQNLSNETYFQTASGARATPADGRRALLTLDYKFH